MTAPQRLIGGYVMYLISTAITGTKIIAAVVILVVIAGGVFFWLRSRKPASQS